MDKNNIKVYALGLAVFIFLGTVIAVYGFASDTGFVRAVTTVIPLPAGRVNGSLVSYRSFFLEQDGIRALLAEGGVELTRDIFLGKAKESLIRFELLKQLAKEYGIRVDRHDIEARYGAILEEREYPKPAERILRRMAHALLLADRLKEQVAEEDFERILEEGRGRVKWYVRF